MRAKESINVAIANEKIFQQIQKECERALLNKGNVREHARAIQALTNLLLDENMESSEKAISTIDSSHTTISTQEWESMVGTKNNTPTQLGEKRLIEKDGNGYSLLDF